MSVRRRAVIGLLAAASLVLTGCAGEGVDDGPDEPSLTMPPEESTSTSADTVLDLETLTDDELLAEAERAYQGMLTELGFIREEREPQYSQLLSWSTPEFVERVEETMEVVLPAGNTMSGSPELVWVELGSMQVSASDVLRTHVCVDNTSVRAFDEAGNDVTDAEAPKASLGTVTFVLSESADRLLVDLEQQLDETLERECSPLS